jgi:AmmeMemoRadiSam system protein A
MPSVEASRLAPPERQALLELARRSIAHGLQNGRALPVEPAEYVPVLRTTRATFVTLKERGQLRGCIGHLEAIQPLVRDVAENAFAAACRDPRFPPLQAVELDAVNIEISVLSPAEPIAFESEEDLLSKIVPGRDGLILEEGATRGTFLPSVWHSLPDPNEFLRHLKLKAGLPGDHWSEAIRISRYTTDSFGE